MRKVFVTTLATLAVLAMASGGVLACGASEASAKAACPGAKASAKLTSSQADAKAACPHSKGTAQLTTEEHAKLCKGDIKCDFTTISVAGMTCGGCEKSVSKALTDVDGVLKVMSVSYEDGIAEVCFDPAKTNGEALTAAIANKGYKAEIVPAVVTTTSGKKGCSKLTGAKSGCCAARKAKVETTEKAEGTH